MIRAHVTLQEAIEQNHSHDSREAENKYGELARQAADYFHRYAVGPVVDLGCGDGAALTRLVELGHSVTGVDIQKPKLDRIKAPANLVAQSMEDWLTKRRSGRTANIFCHHALEHVADPQLVLNEIGRVLQPGGLCLIVVPKDDRPYSVHYTAFESADEIVPPELEVIDKGERHRETPEFWVLARKP